MDSEPKTSDSPGGRPESAFGRAVSARVRPRVARSFRHDRPMFVGVVARSSVGFGRAVGRSQAIRPTVTFDNLNTAALRPPPRWWHDLSSDAMHGDAAPSDSRRSTRPTPSRAPAPPASTKAPAATWTDHLVPPSRFERRRREAAQAGTTRRSPSVPSPDRDFTSTGHPKADALKRMLDAGYTPANAPPEMLHDAQVSAPVRRSPVTSVAEPHTTTAPAEAGRTDWDPSQRRGDTGAGRETAPGSLARSLRPELVTDPPAGRSVPALERAPSASPPSAPGPLEVPVEGRRGRGTSRGGRGSVAPTRSHDRGGARGDRQEALRQMLAARGEALYDPRTGERTSGGAPPWPGDVAGRPAIDEDPRRAAPSATPTHPTSTRPTAGAAPTYHESTSPAPGNLTNDARPADHEPASGLPSAPRPPWADSPTGPGIAEAAPPQANPAPAQRPAPNRYADNSHPQHHQVAPSATSDALTPDPSATPPPGRPVITSPVPGVDAPEWSRSADAPVVAPPTGATSFETKPSAAVDADVPAHGVPSGTRLGDLRLQRMISDRATMTRSTTVAATAVEPVRRLTADALRHRQRSRVVPSLPSQEPDDRPLRRVTLPRAMSFTHRPPTALSDTDRAISPSTGEQQAQAVDDATDRLPFNAEAAGGIRFASVFRPDPATEHTDPSAITADAPDAASIAESAERPRHRRRPQTDTTTVQRTIAPRRRPLVAAPGRDLAWPAPRSIVAPGTGTLREVIRRTTEANGGAIDGDPAQDSPDGPDSPATPNVAASDGQARTRAATDPTAHGAPQPPAAGRAARQAAAAVVAERFMTELSQSVRSQPVPLPMPFRPMAEAITGSDRVLLSTDVGSRRALRSVGKRAATTGNVIHLDRTPRPGHTINEVIAHELTHVANPSPAPRFFDDIDDSPEERRAESVARIMARSPLAPTSGFVAPVRRSDVVRRSPVQGGTNMVTADSAANPLPGTGAVRRSPAATSGSDPTIRRLATAAPAAAPAPAATPVTTEAPAGSVFDSREAREWFERELDRNIDTIMERIEDRVRIGLERRGGRFWREI